MNKHPKRWNPVWIRAAVMLLLGLLVVAAALAAGPSINRWLIGSGGSQVEGSGLVLRQSVGQPVVGAVSNDLTLCSGFVCGYGVTAEVTYTVYLPTIHR